MKKTEHTLNHETGKRSHRLSAILAVLALGALFCIARPEMIKAATEISGDNISLNTDLTANTDYDLSGDTTIRVDTKKTLGIIQTNGYILTILGEGGTLTVSRINTGHVDDYNKGNIIISGANVIVNNGIFILEGSITIEDSANVSVTGDHLGALIDANQGNTIDNNIGNINIVNSTVNLHLNLTSGNMAIDCSRLTINSSTVTITGGYKSKIYANSHITVNQSRITAEASNEAWGIRSGTGNIKFTGSDTVISVSGNGDGDIHTAGGNIIIDAPLKIVTPAGGRIVTIGGQTKIMEADGTTTATEILIKKPDPAPEPEPAPEPQQETKQATISSYTYYKMKAQKEDKGDEEEHSSKPAVFNPDTVEGFFMVNGQILPGVAMGKMKQGVAAQAVFNANRAVGWNETFTFNIAINGKVDYTLKNGTLTFIIPKEYQKAGRTFAVMALDKNGKAWTFADIDTNPSTLTANINVEGYAFALIYKD